MGNKIIIDFIFLSCLLLADVFKKNEKKNKKKTGVYRLSLTKLFLLADLTASDDVTPQAQNMGIRSPMSEGSPKSVLLISSIPITDGSPT